MTSGLAYWGPQFPDAARASLYWDEHFPDGQANPATVVGVGPPTVAAFALELDDGCVVKFAWRTDIVKAYDGSERQRVSLWDAPRLWYQGSAYLVGSDMRATRAQLARIANLAKPIALTLPYEALTLVADSVGATLHVSSTTSRDWILAGQRVAVTDVDGEVSYGVIQSATSTTIVLDVAPGSIGRYGSEVAPVAPVLLDPQQGFGRFPIDAEQWAIAGADAAYGFSRDAVVASVALSAVTSGLLAGATVYFNVPGSGGNGWSLTTIGDSALGTGSVTQVGNALTFHFEPGVTLVGAMVSALNPYGLLFTGTVPMSSAMATPADAFGPATLAGGVDEIFGQMGAGATLAPDGAFASAHGLVLQGLTVWTRGVRLARGGPVGDSIHSLAENVELGAAVFGVGPAVASDWGRQLNLDSDDPIDWQYLKLFLATARGRQKSWWLPTMRDDLDGVSLSPGSLTVDGPSPVSGDFFAWYPALRQLLRVELSDGTVLFFAITGAVDNGDGTLTLSVIGGGTGPTGYDLGAGGSTRTDISLVSWLERCRFESDEIEATWTGGTFSFSALARVVDR